jgi:branched-subunit amino acid ABC-type transport system permease component
MEWARRPISLRRATGMSSPRRVAFIDQVDIVGVSLAQIVCDGVTHGVILFFIVLSLQIARFTTNSYRTETLALAVIAPIIFGALDPHGPIAIVLVFLLSLTAIVVVQWATLFFVYQRAITQRANPATLLVLSFAVFEILITTTNIFSSGASYPVRLERRALVQFGGQVLLSNDDVLVIGLGILFLVVLLWLGRLCDATAKLKALRENRIILVQYGYNDQSLYLWFTFVAGAVSGVGGYLHYLLGSVAASDAYGFFFLGFGVLLLLRDVAIGPTFALSVGLSTCLAMLVFVFGNRHRMVFSSAIVLLACLVASSPLLRKGSAWR